jgi:toxin-antitoxin system PIN domain toxin
VIGLPDVNVLVALAWPNHVHHERARAWLEENHQRGWATCPVTESGFVRVSSNRKVVPEARRPGEAILLLREMTSLRGHVFWADDTSIARSRWVAAERLVGHGQVTDAHLVALCLERKGRLVTFDGGVADVLPNGTGADAVLTQLRA